MSHNLIIPYVHMSYIFISQIVIYFSTQYSGSLHLHRRRLENFYWLDKSNLGDSVAGIRNCQYYQNKTKNYTHVCIFYVIYRLYLATVPITNTGIGTWITNCIIVKILGCNNSCVSLFQDRLDQTSVLLRDTVHQTSRGGQRPLTPLKDVWWTVSRSYTFFHFYPVMSKIQNSICFDVASRVWLKISETRNV